jgi:hypothetical protein
MKLRIYLWYASNSKDGLSKHTTRSWDALIGLYVRIDLILHWWGDALRRVLMYSGGMEMYGVPGRSVLQKKDTRVRIPSLASLKSFIMKAFFFRFLIVL